MENSTLLCCGDQNKQADEAVLQCAEVLWREEAVYYFKSDHTRKCKLLKDTKALKIQRTGSAVFGEKRQKPGRTQQSYIKQQTLFLLKKNKKQKLFSNFL